MLVTLGDIKNDVLVKLNQGTSQGFYTDTLLNTWFNECYMYCASKYKWPMTQSKDTSLTFSQGTEIYAVPAQFKTDSIRVLQIGTSPTIYNIGKTEFEDYMYFREWMTTASDRIWTEFTRNIYINPNMDVAGVITLYGQKNITSLDGTNSDATNTTIFSGAEEEGNEAIAYRMLGLAMMKEKRIGQGAKGKLSGEGQVYLSMSDSILDAIWKRITDERYAYQNRNKEMFRRLNVLKGGYQEEIFKRDQFF